MKKIISDATFIFFGLVIGFLIACPITSISFTECLLLLLCSPIVSIIASLLKYYFIDK